MSYDAMNLNDEIGVTPNEILVLDPEDNLFPKNSTYFKHQ